MMRLIGYVGARDLSVITEEDIRCLDVINIAFGQVRDACMVWDGQACRPALQPERIGAGNTGKIFRNGNKIPRESKR